MRQEALLQWDRRPARQRGTTSRRRARLTWSRCSPASPGGARGAAGRRALRRLGPARHRRRRDRRGVRGAPGRGHRRAAAGRPGRRPAGRRPGSRAARSSSTRSRRAARIEVLAHLLRRATADTFRARAGRASTCPACRSAFDERRDRRDRRAGARRRRCSRRSAPIPGLAALLDRLGSARARSRPGSPPARSSSRWRACTCTGGWPRRSCPRPDGLRAEHGRATARAVPLRAVGRRPRPARAALRRRRRRSTRWASRSWTARRPREALEALLRRGAQGRRGLDDLRRQVREAARARPASAAASTAPSSRSGSCSTRRSRPERRGAVPGPVRRRPAARDRARHAARTTRPARSARSRTTTGARDEARETFEQIQDLLRREVLDSQFKGMKQALRERRRPRTCSGSRTCSPTSTRCSRPTPAARTPSEKFADFMDKHGEFFPENPQTLEELTDSLARRAAARSG